MGAALGAPVVEFVAVVEVCRTCGHVACASRRNVMLLVGFALSYVFHDLLELLRRKTYSVLRSRTSALRRHKSCAVLRARTCDLSKVNTKAVAFGPHHKEWRAAFARPPPIVISLVLARDKAHILRWLVSCFANKMNCHYSSLVGPENQANELPSNALSA